MLAAGLLTLREGLEAALIVSILLTYLGRTGHGERRSWVWAAVGVAATLCLGLALALQAVGASFEGRAEQVFEGLTMLFAVGVLTWMIFWMRRQARTIKGALEAEVEQAIQRRHNWGLFGVAFLAVFREGVETALFLTASSFVGGDLSTVVGGVAGLAGAVAVGWLLHAGMTNLNLRTFFNVTSVLLLLFAAGLFGHGIHELQEAAWLPVLVEHLWDLKPVLDDGTLGGSLLRTLAGYNDNPSLLEAIGYTLYWVVVVATMRWWEGTPRAERVAQA